MTRIQKVVKGDPFGELNAERKKQHITREKNTKFRLLHEIYIRQHTAKIKNQVALLRKSNQAENYCGGGGGGVGGTIEDKS